MQVKLNSAHNLSLEIRSPSHSITNPPSTTTAAAEQSYLPEQNHMSSHQESSQSFHWHYAEFDDSNFQIRGRTLFFIVVLFSVVLVVALLFLYARWVCRFGPPPPTRIASRSAHAPLGPRQGLDATTINSFPIVLHKISISDDEKDFADGECCICLGILCDGEKVKVLPQCQHCFHSECVDKWLATQSSCPLCRGSLRVDSPV